MRHIRDNIDHVTKGIEEDNRIIKTPTETLVEVKIRKDKDYFRRRLTKYENRLMLLKEGVIDVKEEYGREICDNCLLGDSL